jgi:hypothetical protein
MRRQLLLAGLVPGLLGAAAVIVGSQVLPGPSPGPPAATAHVVPIVAAPAVQPATLTDPQRQSAVAILQQVDAPDLRTLLSQHPYKIARSAPVTARDRPEEIVGAMLDISFEGAVTFKGDLPGSTPRPDGSPIEISGMTGMFVSIDFRTNRLVSAVPDMHSSIKSAQPPPGAHSGRD